jgi:OmpA-OmpF porin, OOP family
MLISTAKSLRNTAYLVVGLCALTPTWAAAQTIQPVAGFADDRFEPAGGGSEWFSLESLDFRGNWRPAAGISADLALKPLVIYDSAGHQITSLVSQQALVHVDAALVLSGRLRIDVNAPLSVLHAGTGGTVGDEQYTPPTGELLGDLRLGADLRLIGEAHEGLSIAIGGQVFVPTGHQSAFTSDGTLRLWPHLLLAGEAGPLVWAARLGYHVRPSTKCGCSLSPGNELTGAVAVGFRVLPTMLVGAEAYGSTPASGSDFGKGVASPVEGLLGAHIAASPDWTVGAGVAPGTDGVGSPSWRFVASVQYYPAFKLPAPRLVAEPPPPPPPPRPQQIPPKPAPPQKPALKPAPPKPAPPPPPPPPPSDRDGDGIVDPEDACPDVAGPRNDDPVRNGCPVVRIEGGQIRIREQVKFKTNSAVILKESNYILISIVKLLDENPEIKKVRVEGHTDTQGKPKANKKLSERRAASVVKWLIKHGIKKKRLSSAGYGQERPIATNQTEDGRRDNRRVEFHIVEGPGGER